MRGRVDDSDHAGGTVRLGLVLGAVEPDGLFVLDSDGESLFLES